MGMLRSAAHRALLNADVAALPLRDGTFDVLLAVHMLYHVPDRRAAIGELRRVLAAADSGLNGLAACYRRGIGQLAP